MFQSHSPVPCSLFHKRKSVSLLHHFWLCPLLSSNMLLSMFWDWVLRTSLTTILHRIYDKVKDSQPCQHYHDYFQWLLFIDIIKDTLDKFEKLLMKYKVILTRLGIFNFVITIVEKELFENETDNSKHT